MQRRQFLKLVLVAGDFIFLFASFFVALFVRGKPVLSQPPLLLVCFAGLFVFWIFIIYLLGLYNYNFLKKTGDFIFGIAIFSIIAFFSGASLFYFAAVPGVSPKSILFLEIAIFDLIFIIWRYLFYLFLQSKKIKARIIIGGCSPKLCQALPEISKRFEIAGVFCLSGRPECLALKTGLFFDKDIDSELMDNIDSVLIGGREEEKVIREIIAKTKNGAEIIRFEDFCESVEHKICLDFLDNQPSEKIFKPDRRLYVVAKKIMDLFFGIAGFLIFLLLLPLVSLAVKIDSRGPVFYKQQRVGKNGKMFVLSKFRTMKNSPDSAKKVWREKDGKSVTKVGLFLRKAHIDELPQCLNLLKGDISIVGPRPEWVELAKIFEKEIPHYYQRYNVKPGILGWAQINYPASKSVQEAREKFEYDLYYIKNRSLMLDLEIILKSARLFFLS